VGWGGGRFCVEWSVNGIARIELDELALGGWIGGGNK
jgi:hypothetical protein